MTALSTTRVDVRAGIGYASRRSRGFRARRADLDGGWRPRRRARPESIEEDAMGSAKSVRGRRRSRPRTPGRVNASAADANPKGPSELLALCIALQSQPEWVD